VADEVSEAALAHQTKDRAKAAYLRTDFFEQRKSLMRAWEAHCLSGQALRSSRDLRIAGADKGRMTSPGGQLLT
jgi:hypothetical protein